MLCCECIYDTVCASVFVKEICVRHLLFTSFRFSLSVWDKPTFTLCAGYSKKHLYTSIYLQVSQSDVISCTGKTWQTSQHPQPPGADSANVPTQEFWTSDRKQAQLSQGHYKSASPLTPSLPPTPQKMAPGTSCFASLRQTISTTVHF